MGKGAPDYTRLAHILGLTKLGELIQVRVDDQGRIVSVMTGEYSGSSKVLATDADGRIIAVITDPENIWGVRPIVGNAELAARLGSPTRWDRRGSVIMMDSFQYGLSRILEWKGGTGSSLSLSSAACRSKGYSLKAITGTDGDRFAGSYHPLPLSTFEGLCGIEVHVAQIGTEGTFIARMQFWTGTHTLLVGIRWDLSDGKVYYYGSGGEWVDSGEVASYMNSIAFWNAIKFVVDTESQKYVRAMINDKAIDLDEVSGYYDTDAGNPEVHIQCYRLGTPTSGAITCYIDDVIFTVREPT